MQGHGIPCPGAVAALDGLQYSLVGVQGLLQQSAVGALGEHLHRRRDDGSQLGSHQIAAGAGNGPVELHILVQIVLPMQDVIFHEVVQRFHLGDVLRGGMARRQRGNGRLDDVTHLQQVEGQTLLVLNEIQPQRVIRQAGLVGHKRARAVAHGQNVL